METPNITPLKAIKFEDDRPASERGVCLRFIPTNEDLLETYERICDEIRDVFGSKITPLNTALDATQLRLQLTEKFIKFDKDAVQGCFDLIQFLEKLRSLLKDADWMLEETAKAEAYIKGKGEVSHEL